MRFLGIPVQHVLPRYEEAYPGDYTKSGVWKGSREDWDRVSLRLLLPPQFRDQSSGTPASAAGVVRAHRRQMGFDPFDTEMWREPWVDTPAGTWTVAADASKFARSVQLRGRGTVQPGAPFTMAGNPHVYTANVTAPVASAGTVRVPVNHLRVAVKAGAAVDWTPNIRARYSPTGIYDENFQWGQLIVIAVDIEEALS